VARHRVVDIRKLGTAGTDRRGDREEATARELSWLGGIVEVVTACGVGERWERAIVRCDESNCGAPVALRRTGDACEWYCPGCATFGAIVGWRASRYDLTEVSRADDSEHADAAIFTRIDELDSVRRCTLPAGLRLTLALSSLHADYVVVTCAERELSELLCALEEVIGKVSPVDRRLVDRFVARVDAALLASEAYAEAPPTLH
jgi:hypothetical protein